MVPWQTSHSHLLNNDDKGTNKQNLLKKKKCSFTKASLLEWETGFNSRHICSFEWKSAQHKWLSQKKFPAGEKSLIYRTCLKDPSTALPSADQDVNTDSKDRKSFHRYEVKHTHTFKTWTSTRVPSPHFQMQLVQLTSDRSSTCLQSHATRHWMTKIFKTDHTFFQLKC